jgi:hypothetical protein
MRTYLKYRFLILASGLFALAFILSQRDLKPAWAQGFPFSINFPGAQATVTTDFNNPPISYARVGTNIDRGHTVPFGSVAYGSFGNATTTVAGTVYQAAVWVDSNTAVNNINILNGGTVGTDKGIAAIYNNAGTLIGSSALAGTTTAGANAFQVYALVTPVMIQGPGLYWIGYQSNGTTDNVRTVAASTFVLKTGSTTGTFGTLPALTVATTFTANVGPIAYLN